VRNRRYRARFDDWRLRVVAARVAVGWLGERDHGQLAAMVAVVPYRSVLPAFGGNPDSVGGTMPTEVGT
jgi:hypothetical protein